MMMPRPLAVARLTLPAALTVAMLAGAPGAAAQETSAGGKAQPAKPDDKLTQSTSPDSTYGQGGTKTTTSNSKFTVKKTETSSADKKSGEVREFNDDGTVSGHFYKPDGEQPYVIKQDTNADWVLKIGPGVKTPTSGSIEVTFKTRQEALEQLQKISDHFAGQNDYTITDKLFPANMVTHSWTMIDGTWYSPAFEYWLDVSKEPVGAPDDVKPKPEPAKPKEPDKPKEAEKPAEKPPVKPEKSALDQPGDMNAVSAPGGDMHFFPPEEVGDTPPKTAGPAAPKDLTETTAADSTYGAGGSKTTYSDEKFKVKGETYKDAAGNVKEAVNYFDSGAVVVVLRQSVAVNLSGIFPDDEGTGWHYSSTTYPDGKIRGENPVTGPEKKFATREEAQKYLDELRDRFIDNGIFVTDQPPPGGKPAELPAAAGKEPETFQETKVEPPDLWKPKTAPAPEPPKDGTSLVNPGQPVACLPRDGRTPVSIGSNAKVGSGARATSKALSTLAGFAGGFLGGGGGGGKDGPPVAKCKIKDKEMTVFTDPATGIAMKVAAKQAGDDLFVFAEVDKSPDSGTFQTAFVDGPGGPRAPDKVDICDLWGEWSLTVSWTKTTYVNDQVVSQESGGYSKTGNFVIPGTLSSDQAPAGLWRQLGFSNASHGARKIAMRYRMPPADGPLETVIHITRPGQDPVTSQPFDLVLNRGPNGITIARQTAPVCPEEQTTTAR